MTLSITTHFRYVECHCAECRNLFIVMPNVIMLSVVMMSVAMLTVIMLTVIMLTVIMLTFVMLTVVLLNVIMLTAVMLNVIILNVVMLSVVAPFKPFCQSKLKLISCQFWFWHPITWGQRHLSYMFNIGPLSFDRWCKKSF